MFGWFVPLAAAVGLTLAAPAPPEPITVGGERQLFLGPWAEDGRDDYLVESMRNVTMTMNEARVTGERMIQHDRPWDRSDCWLSVLKDGDVFRMYYGSRESTDALRRGDPYSIILLYAESRDGIHWERPNLKLWEWEGSRDNNILFPNDDFPYVFKSVVVDQVFLDPNAKSPAEKYKMVLGHLTPPTMPEEDDRDAPQPKPAGFLFPRQGVEAKPLRPGHHVFSSPDGIHWKLMSDESIVTGAGDAKYSVAWDALRQIRAILAHQAARPGGSGLLPRAIRRGFPGPERAHDRAGRVGRVAALEPGGDRHPPRRAGQGELARRPDASGFLRPQHPSVRRGRRRVHRAAHLPQSLEIHLRARGKGPQLPADDRRPARDQPRRDSVEPRAGPPAVHPPRSRGHLLEQDDLPQRRHHPGRRRAVVLLRRFIGATRRGSGPEEAGIGRAVLRRDGFISADAAYTGGELTTRPLVFTGSKLQLNMDTGAGGTVQVEIQDQAGNPIPGFALEDADEINGNFLQVPARWRAEVIGKLRCPEGDPDVSALAGRPVRLRFVMRDARLYSFQFVP